jgi:hypothetical protein
MDLRKKQSIPPVASASVRAVTTRTPLNKDALIFSSFFLLYIRIKGHYINTRIGYDDDQAKYRQSTISRYIYGKRRLGMMNHQGCCCCCCCCLLILSSVTISVRMFTTPYNSSNPPARSEIAFAKLL